MRLRLAAIGVSASIILGGCTSGLSEEQQIQEEALDELAEILESDITFYDNFSPVGKQFDCAITQLEDSLFKRFSDESESCIDWVYSFEPVVERLNVRLSNLPQIEEPRAQGIKKRALDASALFTSTPICSDRSDWNAGQVLGQECSDLWDTKVGALDSLVSQRSENWYDFIAETQQ